MPRDDDRFPDPPLRCARVEGGFKVGATSQYVDTNHYTEKMTGWENSTCAEGHSRRVNARAFDDHAIGRTAIGSVDGPRWRPQPVSRS